MRLVSETVVEIVVLPKNHSNGPLSAFAVPTFPPSQGSKTLLKALCVKLHIGNVVKYTQQLPLAEWLFCLRARQFIFYKSSTNSRPNKSRTE